MSKIIIPEDHQKYLQREFPMGLGTVSDTDILVITQALVRCLIYMHSPPGAACPWASCIYIRQCTLACVIRNLYMLHVCMYVCMCIINYVYMYVTVT